MNGEKVYLIESNIMWNSIETCPKDTTVDILVKKYVPSTDTFRYLRLTDCMYDSTISPMDNIYPSWRIRKPYPEIGWLDLPNDVRLIAWMKIPELDYKEHKDIKPHCTCGCSQDPGCCGHHPDCPMKQLEG